jgi:hypothetical protein
MAESGLQIAEGHMNSRADENNETEFGRQLGPYWSLPKHRSIPVIVLKWPSILRQVEIKDVTKRL